MTNAQERPSGGVRNPLGPCPKCQSEDLYVSENVVCCERCHQRFPQHAVSREYATLKANPPAPPPHLVVPAIEHNGTWNQRLIDLEKVVKAQGEVIADMQRLLAGQEKPAAKKR